VKKLTGGFDNGLGAVLIGEHSLASFLSKKSREAISGLFQQYRPVADARVAGTSVRNWIKFRHQSQARLTVVGCATVARIRRPLPRKAAVAADMVRLPPVTQLRHPPEHEY
jgi:hypothetical protein